MPEGAIVIGDKCRFEDRGEAFDGLIAWLKVGDEIHLSCVKG
jgi:hypothetical protein